MEMSIDEALGYMPCLMEACSHCLVKGCDKPIEKIDEAKLMVIETMRKYQQLQADYENRLKTDLKAILVDLQFEIKEHDPGCGWEGYADKNVIDCIIQEKINALSGTKTGT